MVRREVGIDAAPRARVTSCRTESFVGLMWARADPLSLFTFEARSQDGRALIGQLQPDHDRVSW
jgi:hypothetical protein